MSRNRTNKHTKDHVQQLYKKLIAKSISQSELTELYSLMSESGNMDYLNPNMFETWENTGDQLSKENISEHIKEIKNKIEQKASRTKLIRLWGSVAAGFLLLVISYSIFHIDRSAIYYSTDFGERETVMLPDGSKVSLNANSSLSWDKNWKGTGIRNVALTGEAFFEVSHLDKDQKFRVTTSDLDIEVLGTSFNVLNRNTNTEVFLKEGKVKLGFQGDKSKKDTVIMTPGQKISYSKKHDRVIADTRNNEKEASWRNGVLYFEDKSVEEILKEVSQVYGISYSIPDSILAHKKMNFGVPYTDWESTKEAFELTMGVSIAEKNGKYIVLKR